MAYWNSLFQKDLVPGSNPGVSTLFFSMITYIHAFCATVLTVSFDQPVSPLCHLKVCTIAISIAYPAPNYRRDTGTRSTLTKLVLGNNHNDTVG